MVVFCCVWDIEHTTYYMEARRRPDFSTAGNPLTCLTKIINENFSQLQTAPRGWLSLVNIERLGRKLQESRFPEWVCGNIIAGKRPRDVLEQRPNMTLLLGRMYTFSKLFHSTWGLNPIFTYYQVLTASNCCQCPYDPWQFSTVPLAGFILSPGLPVWWALGVSYL